MSLSPKLTAVLYAGYECSKGLAEHGARVIIATHGQNPSGPTPTDQVDGPG